MFSFTGDTVLDPFAGTGTSIIAAARCFRNSIGVEIDNSYVDKALDRLEDELTGLFNQVTVPVG
jgi:DNA modification methylase